MKRLWISIVVFLFASTNLALASEVTATVTGVEQQQPANGAFDSGTVTATVDGYTKTVSFGQFSSAGSLASGIAAKFSQDCNSPVVAHANGATITFLTRDPSATINLNASIVWDTNDFTASSFAVSIPASPTFTPTFQCSPTTIVSGQNVTCDVTLVAGAVNPVSLSVNGSVWSSATPNSIGIAVSNTALTESSAGTYTIAYNYPGEVAIPAASGTTTITVNTNSGAGAGANQLYSLRLTDQDGNTGYDANGNIIKYQDSVNGSWSLSYDSLNRLIASQSSVNQLPLYGCWQYDSFGNMLTQAISNQSLTNGATCQTQAGATTYKNSFHYDTNINQITSGSWLDVNHSPRVGSPSYDSSGAGYMTNDLINRYIYDADGYICATQSVGGGTIIGYLYDAEGDRVAKGTLASMTCDPTQLHVTEYYFIGPNGGVMTEMDSDDRWVRTDVSAAGQLLATYTPVGVHYQISDWLGTRRMQVSPNLGANYVVENTCTSWPFGDQLNCSTPLDASSKHYTGKERDVESGLDYFGARYYGSNIGRWMSPDYQDLDEEGIPDAAPHANLKNPQTLNLYGYVENNPLSKRDYDGHASYQDCNGGTQVCWQGDYNGERDCGGSLGCLFWNGGAGEWQGTDPTAKPDPSLSDLPGMAFTGLTRLMLGDRYGAQQVGYSYARVFASLLGAGSLIPKPSGTPLGKPPIVPEGWTEQPSKKGGGTVYVDPNNPHNRVRVMPGDPNSPNPAQREPYMKVQVSGRFLDATGNEVSGDSPEAHIPPETPMEPPFIP